MSSRNKYEQKKREAMRSMAEAARSGEAVALSKKVSNLFRSQSHRGKRLDLGAFDNVLEVDSANGAADVEGRTTYETFVAETLRHGFLPPVVPQLRAITVGGAISGGGIEASSFRYGFVHESVEEMDVLLADGKVVTCRPDNEHSDLFFGMANSYATLGYILRARVPLVRAGPYVKSTHRRFESGEACFAEMERVCRREREGGKAAFIDGVVFSGDELYMTTGEFVDRAPEVSDYRFMRIYYRSLRDREVDYLKTEDYIWRWDTDWFWCSRAFGMEFRPVRFVFGMFGLLRSPVYWRMRDYVVRSGMLGLMEKRNPREYVIQDVEVPVENAAEFLGFLLKEVGVLPIWLCPAMAPTAAHVFPLYSMDPGRLYVNFGFWGGVPRQGEEGVVNRKVERKVSELAGRKSLYSTSFFPEEEFWTIYNRPAYEKLKDRYDPDRRLRDLYQKCVGS